MEITEKQKKKIAEIAEKYGLKLVLLFGSQVHGKTHAESDIDIGVLPLKALSFEEEVNLATECINIFGMRADFSNLYKAPPFLLREVANTNAILYQCDATAYDDFIAYAYQRFAEAESIFVMHEESIQRFLDSHD